MAKLKQKTIIPNLVKTSGTTHRWKMNHLETVKEPDEENPKKLIERIRTRNVYRELFARNKGTITKTQVDCADRYAILNERAEGATQDQIASVNLCIPSGGKYEPTHAQLQAKETLRFIEGEITPYHVDLLKLMILDNFNCSQIANVKKLKERYVIGFIMSAFMQLEEAFEKLDDKC